MVMGRRPEVPTAGALDTSIALGRIGAGLVGGLAGVPMRRPWRGRFDPATNVLHEVVRTTVQSVMVTAMSLDTPQLRSVEIILDDAAGAVMPPPWRRAQVRLDAGEVGGVPGQWVEPVDRREPGVVIYLHGGGYLATTPRMYTGLVSRIAALAGVRVFVPDYRLAPEFPYPAALQDATAVYEGLLAYGIGTDAMLVAGDSGGGGLAAALLAELVDRGLPCPAGAILLSPEIDLTLSGASIENNAAHDILPADIPVAPYLHGADPRRGETSPLFAQLDGFPPLLVTAGGEEMFVDEIRAFVDRAALSDVEVSYVEEPGMFHVFEIVSPLSRATDRVFDHIVEFVRQHLP